MCRHSRHLVRSSVSALSCLALVGASRLALADEPPGAPVASVAPTDWHLAPEPTGPSPASGVKKRRNPAMMGTGIALASVGGIALIVGFGSALVNAANTLGSIASLGSSDAAARGGVPGEAVLGMLIGGVGGLVIGIPLALEGRRGVAAAPPRAFVASALPRPEDHVSARRQPWMPELRVVAMPGGAGLHLTF